MYWHLCIWGIRGAMVARLTPDQKVACSIHVGFKIPRCAIPTFSYFFCGYTQGLGFWSSCTCAKTLHHGVQDARVCWNSASASNFHHLTWCGSCLFAGVLFVLCLFLSRWGSMMSATYALASNTATSLWWTKRGACCPVVLNFANQATCLHSFAGKMQVGHIVDNIKARRNKK